MTPRTLPPAEEDILYPDSDGKRMSDNTVQYRWIGILYGGVSDVMRDRADVFVAADLLWYPVKGKPKVRQAPDVMVVFGRPKGDRGSYKQWEEDGKAVGCAFEVLSPGNDEAEMAAKFIFYEEYGVQEYSIYDPDRNELKVYVRRGDVLRRVRKLVGWVSPLLGIHFDLTVNPMVVYGPAGQRFLTSDELHELNRQAAAQAEEAQRDAKEARQAAEDARQEANQVKSLNERLAQKLRDLGIDPETLKGS